MALVYRKGVSTVLNATIHYEAYRRLLQNITRIDSFGVVDGVARLAFYGHNLTDEQRSFDSMALGANTAIVFVDLERAEDVSYILAERSEYISREGSEPATLRAFGC